MRPDDGLLDRKTNREKQKCGKFHPGDVPVLADRQIVDASVVIERNHVATGVVRIDRARIEIGKPKIKMAQPNCQCTIAEYTA